VFRRTSARHDAAVEGRALCVRWSSPTMPAGCACSGTKNRACSQCQAVEVKREIFRKCFLMFWTGQQNRFFLISLFPLFTRADRFYWQTNNTRKLSKRQMALVRAEADFPKRYGSILTGFGLAWRTARGHPAEMVSTGRARRNKKS